MTAIVLMFGMNSLEVNAIPHTCRLVADLSDCTCFYPDSYATLYGEKTMRGAVLWQTHGSNSLVFTLNWSRTDDSVNRTVFANYYTDSSSTVLAYTEFHYRENGTDTQVHPDYNDWNAGVVMVNRANDVTVSTLTHEFGHVMGLTDNNENPDSIMCQVGAGRETSVPTNVDFAMLNYMYHNRG